MSEEGGREGLGRRSFWSILWRGLSNSSSALVMFGRSILLARLLSVETFGIYAYAFAIVEITAKFASLGISSAFLHRAPETEDEGRAAAAHFTLKVILTGLWAAALLLFAWVTMDGLTRLALIVITLTMAGSSLNETPRIILVRRVVHRRLALMGMLQTLVGTIVALFLAWQHAGIWALLAINVVNVVVGWWMLYLWRPVWRPRLALDPPVQRYLLRYGSRVFAGVLLARIIDRVDDLWTGTYLGKTALGFYSRAYTFATYPRRFLAAPITEVVRGTYAELKGRREALSRAFFRTNAFIVRTSFLIGGMLSLMAPSLIHMLIGDKWLPMLGAFRVMLFFTLLDPLRFTVVSLFVAVGAPDRVIKARTIQLGVLVVGLFTLGPLWGIVGVALAVDVMLVVGIVALFRYSRTYIDYSLWRLFMSPILAMLLGGGAAWVASLFRSLPLPMDVTMGLTFGFVYAGALSALELTEIKHMFKWGYGLLIHTQ